MTMVNVLFGIILCLGAFWLEGVGHTKEAGVDSVIRGTLILALANETGVVLMADSLQAQDARALPEPAQKLFRLSEHAACMVAGFGSADLPTDPRFIVGMAGIIEKLRTELTRLPQPLTVREILWSMSALARSYLRSTATIREFVKSSDAIDRYRAEIIVAGYDPDGVARLGVVSFEPDSSDNPMRPIVDFEPVVSLVEVTPGIPLVYEIRGQRKIALDILEHPEKYLKEPGVSRYAETKRRNSHDLLNLDELKQLAEALIRVTEKEGKGTVGGERQVAVIRGNEPIYVEQRQFPSQALPIPRFQIFARGRIAFSREAFVLKGVSGLFIDNTFESIKEPIRLDGHFFYGNRFVSSSVRYDGGEMQFHQSNVIRNSDLVIGKEVDQSSRSARQLREGFSWRRVVADNQ